MCQNCYARQIHVSPDPADAGNVPAVEGVPITLRNATIVEEADAPFAYFTPYSMGAGDTFLGSIANSGDSDFVAFTAEAGATYTISLDPTAGSGLDPRLEIYEPDAGRISSTGDVGGGPGAAVTLTFAEAETVYLRAKSQDGSTGEYALAVEAGGTPAPTFTLDEAAAMLSSGASFDARAGDTLTYDMSTVDPRHRPLIVEALAVWTMATGLQFEASDTGSRFDVDIFFQDTGQGAFASRTISGETIVRATVNMNTSWLSISGTDFDTYTFQTWVHEIGHALGLNHPGPYNSSATYGVDNAFSNDSWQLSVMSYFDQAENTSIIADKAYILTPMMSDVLFAQSLYGTGVGQNFGATRYGFNGNTGTIIDDVLDFDGDVALTIVDSGGNDYLDFRTVDADQRISLVAETFSDVNGLRGNLAIARGTLIENATGGRGDDEILGNHVGNVLVGGAGDDTLFGEDGDDTLEGGPGNNRLVGGEGDDRLMAGTGVDAFEGGAGDDWVLYRFAENAIEVDLAAGVGTGGAAAGDTFGDVEWVVGTRFADTFIGSDGSDIFSGLGGSDTMDGGAGNDTFFGGPGPDVIDGGDGVDRAIYSTSPEGVVIDLGAGTSLGGEAEGDTLTSIERITASRHDDVVIGSAGGDTLNGLGGDDMLVGGGGVDALLDGAGTDTLTGGADRDDFVLSADGVLDVITDFEVGLDIINLRQFALSAFEELFIGSSDDGADAEIVLAGTDVLVLEGFLVANALDDLRADDFFFT